MAKEYQSAYLSDHAFKRCGQRSISPFLVKLCHTFGRKLSRDTKLLDKDGIPEGLMKSFKHSLRNRIEHQLPIVGVFDEHGGSYTVITAFRATNTRRIRRNPCRDTFMSKLSLERHTYSERHPAPRHP